MPLIRFEEIDKIIRKKGKNSFEIKIIKSKESIRFYEKEFKLVLNPNQKKKSNPNFSRN